MTSTRYSFTIVEVTKSFPKSSILFRERNSKQSLLTGLLQQALHQARFQRIDAIKDG